jgi:transposase
LPARKALNGIFYVLKTGCQWKMLPREFGAPSTIHGKFRLWICMGIFEKIMQKARGFYEQSLTQPISWFAIDSSYSKAPLANNWSGKNPTDRGKRGIKRNIIVDLNGAPLVVTVGAGNRHDSIFFYKTFKHLHIFNDEKIKIIAADSAYDNNNLRKLCAAENFVLLAATNMRRNKNRQKYKPSFRWVIERTFGWLAWFRGLKICWAKTETSYLALLMFAASCQLFKMGGIFG